VEQAVGTGIVFYQDESYIHELHHADMSLLPARDANGNPMIPSVGGK
jgi:hypothetical protein